MLAHKGTAFANKLNVQAILVLLACLKRSLALTSDVNLVKRKAAVVEVDGFKFVGCDKDGAAGRGVPR
jgi:hypothetical protein